MRRQLRARGDPEPYPRFLAVALILVTLIIVAIAFAPRSWGSATRAADSPALEDTTGSALLQWTYDSWTVPWVQVRGATPMLAPAAHATLMVLACESANLERDRLARHLSAAECEHRMAAIRADQDTALIFRLDMRVFDYQDANALARLDPRVTLTLEDDRGRSWRPIEIRRGPAVQIATGQKIVRAYYYPPWLRGSRDVYPRPWEVSQGRALIVAEHRARFARRDNRTGQPALSRDTRWLRIRLSMGRNEWVATWPFREDERPRGE